MGELIKYDAACRALAKALVAARSVPDVKSVRAKSIALQTFARQAKNKGLEADAFEIRIRSEHRLGEMMAAQPKATGGEHGGKKSLDGSRKDPSNPTATLGEAGIDKHLAHRARLFNALTKDEFEELVTEAREDIYRSAERSAISKLNRRKKHQQIAASAINLHLSNPGPFPLIYADPPWKWGHFGEPDQENEKGKGRTPDQHYPTLTYEDIREFRVADQLVSEIAHKDAALFLWCTSANIEMALEVMRAWGFTYKAHAVWIKDRAGMGLVFRNKHEPLLYGTRGNMPGPQHQPPSVFEYPRGRHSAKPPAIRGEIEKMYPDFNAATRLELFARETMEGWTAYGYEAKSEAA